MDKYLNLFQLSWQSGLTYRVNILMWRFRQFLQALISLTLWSVIFRGQENLFNYDRQMMLNYVFLTALLQSLILATALQGLASDIYSGKISQLLIKPVNTFVYWFTEDLADKAKNVFFVIIELTILYAIFQPRLQFPSLTNGLLFILAVILGLIIIFLIMLLFGFIGFWSPESWAPKFLFYMFIEFTSGKLFPLDILPKIIQQLIYLTPFPYFTFIQTQIFLERNDLMAALRSVAILTAWILGLLTLAKFVWQKGIKDYSAVGQ